MFTIEGTVWLPLFYLLSAADGGMNSDDIEDVEPDSDDSKFLCYNLSSIYFHHHIRL